MEQIILPALGITDDAAPDAAGCGGKDSIIFRRLYRLQAENLDMGAGFALEVQACGNYLCIVEHHDRSFGNKVREIAENEFVHMTVTIAQQFGSVAFRKGIFGYPLIRERIIEIFYMDIGYHREILEFDAKLHNTPEIRNKHGDQTAREKTVYYRLNEYVTKVILHQIELNYVNSTNIVTNL
jgi:hypothetical protein